jgi:hypothetical protein
MVINDDHITGVNPLECSLACSSLSSTLLKTPPGTQV